VGERGAGKGVRAAEHDSGRSGRAPREVWGTGWARAGTGQAVSPARGARRGRGMCHRVGGGEGEIQGRGFGRGRECGKETEVGHDGGVEGVDAGDGFDAVGKMPTDATSTGMGRALMRDWRASRRAVGGVPGEGGITGGAGDARGMKTRAGG
jgi:hypothetical protein